MKSLHTEKRVVLDSNVIISAFRTKQSACFDFLSQLLTSEIIICISPVIRDEVLRVAKRKRTMFSEKQFELLSDFLATRELHTPSVVPNVVLEDPDDNHVLACAIAAQASIVTGDAHLLTLADTPVHIFSVNEAKTHYL